MAEFQVFLSYARKDDLPKDASGCGPVERFKLALEARFLEMTGVGLRVFFDQHDIQTAADWEGHIRKGLRESRAMLAVLSPNAFASPWCEKEWQVFAQHEAERFLVGEGIRPMVLVSLDGQPIPAAWKREIDRRQLPLSPLSLDEWMARIEAETLEKSVSARESPLLGWLVDLIDRRDRAEAQLADGFPRMSPFFVGRGDELRQLRDAVQGTAAVVSAGGIGGVGKTELARAYGHAFAYDYPGGRFFIGSEGAERLLPLLARHLAPRFGLDLDQELRAQRERAQVDAARLREIEERGGFDLVREAWHASGSPKMLVVLDNVDQPGLLRSEAVRQLPSPTQFDLLVTTRSAAAVSPEGGRVVDVGLLSEADAMELLAIYRPLTSEEELAAAREILRLTGRLTLAVRMAAVYLERNPRVSVSTFARRIGEAIIREFNLAVLDDPSMQRVFDQPEKYLSVLFEPTLNQLSPEARRAVDFAAHMAPDAVGVPWVLEQAGPMEERATERVLRELFDHRILEEGEEANLVRMHRLLQAAVQHRQGDEAEEFREWVLAHVAEAVDGIYKEAEAGQVAAHQWKVVSGAEIGRLEVGSVTLRGKVLNDCGAWWFALASYSLARELFLLAIRIETEALGEGHPTLAIRFSNLAAAEKDLGNLDEAKDLLQRAIAIEIRTYGEEHPTLAISYSNLAMVEKDLGNLDEAKDLLKRAIAIEIRTYGEEHPTLAIRYSNLAMVERDLGNLGKAKDLLKRAIAIEIRTYEEEHPTLAIRYSNLAMVERDFGNLGKAKDLLQRAIAIKIRTYGEEHPTLATTYSTMATVEIDLGNMGEAKDLLQRAIAIEVSTYGEERPTLATRYSNLALVEQDLGNLGEARRLMRLAQKLQLWYYGADSRRAQANQAWLRENGE